jgi:hypothetical protein
MTLARLLNHRCFPPLLIAAIVALWLWPITLAGRMPLGGDVTSFFLPLMEQYRRALVAGEIPFWNELWGYGFPTLAESQTGVFYPPHLVLFRLFETESAYSINLVVHLVLAGWFAYWCGREFGLRRWGATLTGIVFAGNGFFVIHLPHQWSYTTGCWLPLAVGLAWRACGSCGRRRILAMLALAATLALQMLAGHFQIAFYTQVVVLLIGAIQSAGWLARWVRRPAGKAATAPAWNGLAAIWPAVSVAAAFLLAAVQIEPTRELIGIALPAGRDFEYLSGFANSPLHLVSYFCPTWFHVHPLWRPVAWDPFHTSPEECFSYVGLLPLCLALATAWRYRREPRVRLWAIVAAVTLLLSLGPYQPLFRGLIRLPGFDGFRAASRWSVTMALFLALLAGRGVDAALAAPRLRRWLLRLVWVFFAAAAAWGTFLGLIVAAGPAPGVARSTLNWLQSIWQSLSPWEDPQPLARAASAAHDSRHDLRALSALAKLARVRAEPGAAVAGPAGLRVRRITLAAELPRILLWEVLPPLLALGGLVGCAVWLGRRRVPRALVLGVVVLDLGMTSGLRPTDFAPRGRILGRSPVLRHLAGQPRGARVLDGHQNLSMLAGAAPVASYRTVDIPTIQSRAHPPSAERYYGRLNIAHEIRPGGFGLGPGGSWVGAPPGTDRRFDDSMLGRIVYGPGLLCEFPEFAGQFEVRTFDMSGSSRAWYWPAGDDRALYDSLLGAEVANSRPPSEICFAILMHAPLRPLPEVRSGSHREFVLHATGPGGVIISELDYPGRKVRVVPEAGRAWTVVPQARSSCVAVPIPHAGTFRLQLTFESAAYRRGQAISIIAVLAWLSTLGAMLLVGLRRRGPKLPELDAPPL